MTASMTDLERAAGALDALDAYDAAVMDENRIWLAKIIAQALHSAGLLLPEGCVAVRREPTEADVTRVGLAIIDAHGQWEIENNRAPFSPRGEITEATQDEADMMLWGKRHVELLARTAIQASQEGEG